MEKNEKKDCLFIFTNIITKQWGSYPNQGVGGNYYLPPPPSDFQTFLRPWFRPTHPTTNDYVTLPSHSCWHNSEA